MGATASGVRIGWADLPASVRAAVEEVLGDRVVAAASQPGGFSPGTADRVLTAGGRRAFVKAVHPDLDEGAAELHRREARVTAALPDALPVPRLLGAHDDGAWVALVLQDVEGRHPATPWVADELDGVLASLAALAALPAPLELADLGAAEEDLREDLDGWRRLAAEPPSGLDPWAAAHLPALVELGSTAPAPLAGDRLVHTDLRADNLLLRPDGRVVVVDWPWAARGAAWLDTAMLLVNVELHGGHDVEALVARWLPDVAADDLTALLVGMAGYFTDAARRPPPRGLPTVRAFQAAQATSTLAWVRRRLG